MNFEELIHLLTQYYGQDGEIYPKPVLHVLSGGLKNKSPEYLQAVYQVLVINYSRKWKMLPDLAIINEYKKEIDEACKTLLLKSQRALPVPVETVDHEGLKKVVDCLNYAMTGKKPEWTR